MMMGRWMSMNSVADLTLVPARALELVLLIDTDIVPHLVPDLALATDGTGTVLDLVTEETVGNDEATGKTAMVVTTVAAVDLVLPDVVQVGMVRPDRTGRRVLAGL